MRRLNLIGALIAVTGLFTIAASHAVGLAIAGFGIALLGLHAILFREYRWGHRPLMLHYGASAMLRGLALVVIGITFGMAAFAEDAAPGYLSSGGWTSGVGLHVVATLGTIIALFWIAAYIADLFHRR